MSEIKMKQGRVCCLMIFGMVWLSGTVWAERLQNYSANDLCVTSGNIVAKNSHIKIDSYGVRAQAKQIGQPHGRLKFKYHGYSTDQKTLASDEMRIQIGLKLKAQDSCNVVYIMRRIYPVEGISVAVKWNPGKKTHAQCGANGYINVKPTAFTPIAKNVKGQLEVLEAKMLGQELFVYLNDQLVWQGVLPSEALKIYGPVGFRTDNGKFNMMLSGPANGAVSKNDMHRCVVD